MSAPSNTTKYANLNLNDRLGEKRPGQGGGPGTGNGTLTKGGLLLLSKVGTLTIDAAEEGGNRAC